MNIKDDLREIANLVKTMDDQLKSLEDLNDLYIKDTLGFNESCKTKIKKIKSVEDIDNLTERDLYDYFTSEDIENSRTEYEELENKPNDTFLDYMKDIVKNIKNGLDEITRLEKEKDDLIKNANSITDNYFAYINSDEFKEKKLKRIEQMKEQAEKEENSSKKRDLIKQLEAMENAETLMFMYEHINEVGKKEIGNIVDIYFHRLRSAAVIDKFKAKMPKLGYNPRSYTKFFDLEEKFLGEEYYAFNNLFLFNVMRYISHADVNSKIDSLYSSVILLKIYNLVYHKFDTAEHEKEFIEFIKKFDDQFIDYKEKFEKDNATAPNHPERIAARKVIEEKKRVALIAALEDEGVEVDSTKETYELEAQLKEIREKQSKEAEEETKSEFATGTTVESDEEVNVEDATTETSEEVEEVKSDESNISNFIDKIDSSSEVDEFDKFMEEVSNDLESVKVPENESPITKEFLDTHDDATKGILKVEETKSDEMIVTQDLGNVEEKKEEPKKPVTKYYDTYNCYYVQQDNGTFAYYEKTGELIEDNIPEDDILRLQSSGNLRKEVE